MAAALLASGCHGRAPVRPRPGVESHAAITASCGSAERLQTAFAATLLRGIAPETSPVGQCVAQAARQGSVPAAMLLADVYHQAIVAVAAIGGGGIANAPALRLDLFGRHIGWLHLAAERGDASAQYRLAQATDGVPYRPMSNPTLAWYQSAAQNGSEPALAAIGMAFRNGRIDEERLYALKSWLSLQAHPGPAGRGLLRVLASGAASRRVNG